ncbi:hypothetical protein D5R93_00050 [Actinomyces lilanjuaniae]|uniref:Heavy-metal chelation domain-containing protein n=1 Tax=Actinomyces lilanjuaniae TaxID=2321394 RepID=A0ABM6Z0V0_9ACTO|nr:DUF364 domain-containing protein [Actinomyces lilanjuaniae]AYD88852.1 hypothetical protein D5R93_00050 [Actinomyces lilanjuaniae]
MTNPWEIYDALIDCLPADIRVTRTGQGPRWTRVLNSAESVGSAWTMDVRSRPALVEDSALIGKSLRDVAALVRSWNLAEASVGLAAVNSWYSAPGTAEGNGFVPTGEGTTWRQVFDPFAADIAGKKVAVVGHFPFAQAALAGAAEYSCLERVLQPGDYPDSACEYILPECDYVFISSSSFVNKTTPRLIALSRQAYTVLVGPSTPLHPVLLDHGVDTVTGYVFSPDVAQADAFAELVQDNTIGSGYRVHRHRA